MNNNQSTDESKASEAAGPLKYEISIFEHTLSKHGQLHQLTWYEFCRLLIHKEVDSKESVLLFASAELEEEPDEHGVLGTRRTAKHVIRRTMVTIDIDSKEGQPLPMQPMQAIEKLKREWGGPWAFYTSYSHKPQAPRYRIVIPIDPAADLPADFDAVTPIAERLGLRQWLDTTKTGAQCLFYFPACNREGTKSKHAAAEYKGQPLGRDFFAEDLKRHENEERKRLEERRAAADLAEKRRQERAAKSPGDIGLIEKGRLACKTVEEILLEQGYTRVGKKWLHPNSSSGIPGVSVLRGDDGIARAYSHNWTDPIYTHDNGPKALDNIDLTCLFYHGGNWAEFIKWLSGEAPKSEQYAGSYRDPLEGLDELLNKTQPGAEKAAGEPSEGQQEAASATGEDQPKQDRKLLTATPYVWRPPEQIPPRRFIYGKHLVRGFVSGTVAPGGMGKSTLIMAEALDMATGGKTLGIAKEQFRVWTFNGEDPHEELERKVAATMEHYDIKPGEIGDRLFMDSGHVQQLVIAEETRDGAKIMLPVVEALVEQIRILKLDVLQLDPFVSVHHVTENDNNKIDAVVKTFSKIAHATGCAVELVHHSRKTNGQEVTAEDSRGASSLISAARSARVLNRAKEEHGAMLMKAGEPFNPRSFFSVSDGKKNLAPQDDKSDWFRLASVMLPNGDNVGVVEAVEPVGAFDGVTESHLTQVQFRLSQMPDGMAENSQAEDWIGELVSEVTGLPIDEKGERNRVSKVIAAWIGNAALEVRTVQNPRSRREQKRVFLGSNRGAGK